MATIIDKRAEQKATGGAYGRTPAHPNDLLVKAGPGEPLGEYLRRFWQPVIVARKVTHIPQQVRILGEDLIVFRDKTGRPGLLYPRCMHRGTSLYYGKVDERGIRCCYHGWVFDVEGNCLEQPCEPNGGLNRAAARQPWYPVAERYGLLFAYMGPPSRKPPLPRFDVLENLQPGERLAADDGEYYGATFDGTTPVAPYSWIHMHDNFVDPFHVQVLHATFSNEQFPSGYEQMPKVEFETYDEGVNYIADRSLSDGRKFKRIGTIVMPNIGAIPPIEIEATTTSSITWTVPVDDGSHRMLQVKRTFHAEDRDAFPPFPIADKLWNQMTPEERRNNPSDYEAQMGQGPMSLHSEEHLAMSDRGIVLWRRRLQQEIARVQAGEDPSTLSFDEDHVSKIPSGNFIEG